MVNPITASDSIQSVLENKAYDQGTSTDAGVLLSTDLLPVSRATNNKFQTTLAKIATWVISSYQGFLQNGTGMTARTLQSKMQDFVHLRDAGAAGDGVTNDSTAFASACVSNTYVYGRAGDTYLINPLRFANLVNFTLDLQGATLLITTATPTGAGQATALTMQSTGGFGNMSGIRIINGKINYVNAPSSRVDNNFGIYGDGIAGLEINNIEIVQSWSAGIWISRSNDIYIRRNHVHNTKADGITCQAAGSNVYIENNKVHDTGDDMIAVTWFTGDVPSYVGLTDSIKQTRNVNITGNSAYNGGARGIFLGGILGGTVSRNWVNNSNATGISCARDTVNVGSVFYSTGGVNNANNRLDISYNILTNCSWNSNSPFQEVGGIWIQEYNLNIKVHHNQIIQPNNIGIQINGNAEVTQNTIDSPTLQAGGTVTLAQMTGNGGHISIGDFNSTSTCYGKVTNNTFLGGLFRAVTCNTAYSTNSWRIEHNELENVGNLSNASNGTNINQLIYVLNVNNAVVRGNIARDNRASNTIPNFIGVNSNSGTLVADNLVQVTSGLATEVAVTSATLHARSKVRVTYSASALTLAANTQQSITTSFTGLPVNMGVNFIPPGPTQGCQVTCELTAAGTIVAYIANPTAASITIVAGTWTFIVAG